MQASDDSKVDDGSKSLWTNVKETIVGSWSTIRWFVIILAVVIGAALIAHWNSQRAQQFSAKELDGVRTLIDYATKCTDEAQRTHNNSLQSLLHTNYAICFINAAKHMVGGDVETLQTIIGAKANVAQLHAHLNASQAQLLRKIRQQCYEKYSKSDLLNKKSFAIAHDGSQREQE